MIATLSDTRRRDALLAALRTALPEWRVRVPHGGLTLWAELDGPISSALARAAEEVGVRLAPGPRFGLDGTLERFLRLPFTLPPGDPAQPNPKRILAVCTIKPRHIAGQGPEHLLSHVGGILGPHPGFLTPPPHERIVQPDQPVP